MAVRFLVARAGDRQVREALHRAEQLHAGQRLSGGGLGRTLLREVGGALREMLALRAMTGQSYNPTPRGPTHEMQLQSRAAEAKAHSPLLTMQIQLWVHAPTPAEAEDRFGPDAGLLRAHSGRLQPGSSPTARGASSASTAASRIRAGGRAPASWRGLAEAHALTGRSLVELETFVGTQVWTRWGGRYGDVPHDRGLRLGRTGYA